MDKFEKEELKETIRKLKKIIKRYRKEKNEEFAIYCCEYALFALEYELREEENK